MSAATTEASPEEFSYDDAIVRQFLAAAFFWLLISVAAGLALSLWLLAPEGGDAEAGLTVGRYRPVHAAVSLYAVVANALFAGVYFCTQRLCKAAMFSRTLSQLHFWSWQLVVGAGLYSLAAGISQDRVYAEFEWPVDVAIAAVWVLFFGVNFVGTLLRRRERYMYVSLWFFLASWIGFALVHVGNAAAVSVESWGAMGSDSLLAGVQDTFLQRWYRRGAMGFLTLLPFLGFLYYFLPHANNAPIRSYRLAVLQFWSLVGLLLWTASHNLHFTAIPEWTQGVATVAAVLMFFALWAGVMNGWPTFRGRWAEAARDPARLALAASLLWYAWAVIDETLLGLNVFSAAVNYSSWVVAHAHAVMVGFDGFLLLGMLFYVAPTVYQAGRYSRGLSLAAVWAMVAGSLLLTVPQYVSGVVEASMWRSLDENAQLRYSFLQTLEAAEVFWWATAAGGVVYAAASLLAVASLVQIWLAGPARYERRLVSASRFDRAFVEPMPAGSSLDVVLNAAKKIDVWTRLEWHRKWERKPLWIAAWIAGVLLLVSALQFLPVLFIRGNVPPVATVQPYTPLELIGRAIYRREGCYQCHTQSVRALVAETKRYGTYTRPGETVYDSPALWGTRRVGPDLWREGGRQSNLWHYQHLLEPRRQSPGSVMPSYGHLIEQTIDYSELPELLEAAKTAGASYAFAEDQVEEAARLQAADVAATLVQQGGPVRTQDQEATAVIAYLQRLGTDLNRTPGP